jgi:hypothetical protein
MAFRDLQAIVQITIFQVYVFWGLQLLLLSAIILGAMHLRATPNSSPENLQVVRFREDRYLGDSLRSKVEHL